MEENNNRLSPKQRLKNSLHFLSCCFGRPNRNNYLPSPPSDDKNNQCAKPDKAFSEIKIKCKAMLGYNKPNALEYSYDPLSYSLNFEDGFAKDEEPVLVNTFCARLPPSPPPLPVRV